MPADVDRGRKLDQEEGHCAGFHHSASIQPTYVVRSLPHSHGPPNGQGRPTHIITEAQNYIIKEAQNYIIREAQNYTGARTYIITEAQNHTIIEAQIYTESHYKKTEAQNYITEAQNYTIARNIRLYRSTKLYNN